MDYAGAVRKTAVGPAKMSRQRKIGTYTLAGDTVDLFVEPGSYSASFYGNRMVIGVAGDWEHVLGLLVHELAERMFCSIRARYKPDIDMAEASDSFYFFATHNQFTEVCSRVGWFLAQCVPDVSRAYREARRGAKRGG